MIDIVNNDSESKDNLNEDNINISENDLRDLELLRTQGSAIILMIYGYVLEYISTMESIEVIKLKYINSDSENKPDPDVKAVRAAELQLFSQMILVQIAFQQFKNYAEHYDSEDLNVARSANYEIYIGDVIELIAYIISLIGVRNIYKINHPEPVYGV